MPNDVNSPGRLIGMARRSARLEPMEEIASGSISVQAGLDGDHKGTKFPSRQITVMSIEAWRLAAIEVGQPHLHWTTRRANLLVEGVDLPRARGGVVRIGGVRLEVTNPTLPCKRMEDACPGLRKALYPDWRGGMTCRVLQGGDISLRDAVEVLASPRERVIRLP